MRDDLLKPEVFAMLANDEPVETLWPKDKGTRKAIDNSIREVVERLRIETGKNIDADFDSYGCGYASYVHVHLSELPHATKNCQDVATVLGLTIYVSRLVPYFTYGTEFRYWQGGTSASTFLVRDRIEDIPLGNDWTETISIVGNCMRAFGYSLMTRDLCNTPVPSDVKWDSNFEKETLFDLVFHWND